eukprot:837124-Pyramimonas_sp.AAC.1
MSRKIVSTYEPKIVLTNDSLLLMNWGCYVGRCVRGCRYAAGGVQAQAATVRGAHRQVRGGGGGGVRAERAQRRLALRAACGRAHFLVGLLETRTL